MSRWFEPLLARYAALEGYVQPEDAGGQRMDSNENFAVPRGYQDEALGSATPVDVRSYPVGGADRLARALAKRLRVPERCVCVGSGSDQLLDMLLGFFAGPRTRLVMPDPAFSFFEARCRLHRVPLTRVRFSDDMTLDWDLFRSKMAGSKMLYLDSPNNPTGFQFEPARVESLLDGYGGLAVIDEAYAMFGRPSAARLAPKSDNVVVTGTLSKSHGLAGLRVGYMVAPPELAGVFRRVIQYPYPVSSLSLASATGALAKPGPAEAAARQVRSERARMVRELRRHRAFEVFDSQGNFVLFDAGGAAARIYAALLEQGISVRRLGRIGSRRGCMRVSVGTREMNSRFLLAVRDLLV